MSIFQAIILGLIQGVTEFLPVSSSGHLVLAETLFGLSEPQLNFAIAVHFGTLLAIVFYFKNELLNLGKAWLVPILVGSIPAGIIGLFFKDTFEALFGSVLLVGVFLIITGLINLWLDKKLGADKKAKSVHQVSKPSIHQALVVGVFQAVAIFPGISRSGSTIAAGVGQKLSRGSAFFFSFLLAIVSIGGATLLQLIEVANNLDKSETVFNLPVLFVGVLTAAISGYFSLSLLSNFLKKARFEIFGWYCIVVGLVVVVTNLT